MWKKIDDGASICVWCGAPVEIETQPEPGEQSGSQPGAGSYTAPFNGPVHVQMSFTEIGLTVGLLGAAVYFGGMFNELFACLLAGYILLKEKDAWLRTAAVKAVMIIIGFAILNGCVVMLQNLLNGFDNFLSLVGTYPLGYTAMHQLCSLLINCINIAQNVMLLVGGCLAVKYKNFNLGKIDEIINRGLRR